MNTSNSFKEGETLIDTAMTLNATHPDLIIIRHQDSGAPNLLSQKLMYRNNAGMKQRTPYSSIIRCINNN